MIPDVADIAEAEDPYSLLAALRSHGPVTRLTSGFVAVTGYDAAVEVMRRADFASAPIGGLYRERLPSGAARDEMANRINFLDPPDHPRVRRLLSKAFTPRRVSAMTPWIERTSEALLDGLAHRASLDLLAEFAHELPSLVISELLGVPASDRDRLTELSDAVSPLLSPMPTAEEINAACAAADEMHDHLGELIERRRAEPSDDLLSALVAVEDEGDRLSRAELLSLAATLYSAGHRTTRDAFANGMARLLSAQGASFARMVDGECGVAAVARELLRLDTPTLYVARIAATDVNVSGCAIGAGDPMLIYLAAANRDPSVFSDPELFEPGRDGPPPLSFAHGAHYCLGASLAATELEVMLHSVSRKWPRLRLEADELRWHQRGPFRGLDRLDVSTAEG